MLLSGLLALLLQALVCSFAETIAATQLSATAVLVTIALLRTRESEAPVVHAFTRVSGGRQGTLIVQCCVLGVWQAINFALWVASLRYIEMSQLLALACVFGLLLGAVRCSYNILTGAVVCFTASFWTALSDSTDNSSQQLLQNVGGSTALAVGFASDMLRRRYIYALSLRTKNEDVNPQLNSAVANYVHTASCQFAALWSAAASIVLLAAGIEAVDNITLAAVVTGALLVAPFALTDLHFATQCALAAASVLIRMSFFSTTFQFGDVASLATISWCAVSLLRLGRPPSPSAVSTDAYDPAVLFATQKDVVKAIYANAKSRKLMIFLVINFAFMGLELVTGIRSNSLGLICDAIHMMMDSLSIAIGLYAAVVAMLPPSEKYPFGRTRFEVISAFLNGILLLIVALGTFVEAIQRIIEPRDIRGLALLPVSVGGLVVNLVGVFFFHEGHSHHGHSHSPHSAELACGTCDEECHHYHASDTNMRGVYLHVVADLLGSVSVIVSSFVIHMTGFTRADPLCSMVVVVIIAFAAKGLIQDSAGVLLLSAPVSEAEIDALHDKLCQLAGVQSVPVLRTWVNSPSAGDLAVQCMVSVRLHHASSEVDYDALRADITRIIIDAGCASSIDALTVEISE